MKRQLNNPMNQSKIQNLKSKKSSSFFADNDFFAENLKIFQTSSAATGINGVKAKINGKGRKPSVIFFVIKIFENVLHSEPKSVLKRLKPSFPTVKKIL